MKTRNPISKLWKLTLAAALLLSLAPALRAQTTTSPCPHVCGYTFDPVTHCCVTGPQFDCYDYCLTNS